MAIDHVVHAAGSADDDVLPRLQNPDVLLYVGAADAGVTKNAHVVTQSQHNLRITVYERGYPDRPYIHPLPEFTTSPQSHGRK